MPLSTYKLFLLIGLAAFCRAPVELCAQEARPQIEPRPKPAQTAPEADNQRLAPNLRIDTNQVLIPVTVTTR